MRVPNKASSVEYVLGASFMCVILVQPAPVSMPRRFSPPARKSAFLPTCPTFSLIVSLLGRLRGKTQGTRAAHLEAARTHRACAINLLHCAEGRNETHKTVSELVTDT